MTADAGPALASHQAGFPRVRTVVCYLRTANPGTVGQRHLQRQRGRLEVACAAHEWIVLEWVEDLHQSGATLERPGLRYALALLGDHQADALLATDSTPLAVDSEVTGQLVALAAQQSWQLLTVTPTHTSTLALGAIEVDPSGGRGGARR